MSFLLKSLSLAIVFSGQLQAIEKVDALRVEPDNYKMKFISKEPIIGSIDIRSNQVSWISAQKLWRWDLKTNSLNFIRITTKERLVVARRLKDTSAVILATNKSLFSLNKDQLKTVARQTELNGYTKNIIVKDSLVYWVRDSDIWEYDLAESSLKKGPLPNLQRTDKVVTVNDDNLYLTRNNFLISYKIKTGKLAVLQKSFAPFLGGKESHGKIFLNSIGGVIQLSKIGKLERVIPITDERELIAADFQTESHAYLLSDGTVEVYDLNKHKTIFFITRPPIKKSSDMSLAHNGDTVVLAGPTWVEAYLYSRSNSAETDGML